MAPGGRPGLTIRIAIWTNAAWRRDPDGAPYRRTAFGSAPARSIDGSGVRQGAFGRTIVHAPSGNAWTGRHRCVHRVPFGSDPPRACWTASRPEALPLASGSVACCSAAFACRILSCAIRSSDERTADVDASKSFEATVVLVGLFSDCARTSAGDAARGRFRGPVFGWDTGAGCPLGAEFAPYQGDGIAAGIALPGECRRAHKAEDGGLCRRTCRDWNASVDAPGDESGRIDLSAH